MHGDGSGTYHLDLDIVRFWRWDLSDAIPVGTMSMTCSYSILSSLLDDSHGEELRALHGADYRCVVWLGIKSDMYIIWTAG
jgi:hypothetical protein